MTEIAVVGIDLGKNVLHLIAMDGAGHIVKQRKYTRPKLFALFRSLPPCLVGMEACAGAH
jgi:transposase